MFSMRLQSAALLGSVAAALTIIVPTIQAADEQTSPPRSAKQDLTAQNLAKLHALIRPHDNEWRHLRVQWLTDVAAVRKQAIAEDKPIIICYTGGAGYNEPLGVC